MAALKKGCRDGGRLRTTYHVHLPSLSPDRERTNLTQRQQPPQPLSTDALHAANLKDEALYLGSILRARLSDSAKNGNGRGLLSRALARGELDQFLVAFFSDPANLLFAREKVAVVGVRCFLRKISGASTRRQPIEGCSPGLSGKAKAAVESECCKCFEFAGVLFGASYSPDRCTTVSPTTAIARCSALCRVCRCLPRHTF